MKSQLELWRQGFLPTLPRSIQSILSRQPRQKVIEGSSVGDWRKAHFPHLISRQGVEFIPRSTPQKPLRVGVLLSGGQAPGGHNVVIGLLHALLARNRDSKLLGFLGGVKGLIENRSKELSKEWTDGFLNSGGFDMIGSGRTKLEAEEDFEKAADTIVSQGISGVVIIGGDDSNTNAAFLSEHLLSKKIGCSVIGVPKTIDGDFRSDQIEMNFGFDTATKVYSEMIGNLLKDLMSQRKYWFFVKLMGRSASHIALECSLQCHPNLTLIAEEKKPVAEILGEMRELIEKRAKAGKNFGLILIPEGIVENFPEWKEKAQLDPHGNVEVSKIETERRFIEEVKKILDPEISFSPLPFFLGYEGRSATPTLFDAHLGYALGALSGCLIDDEITGVVASIQNLKARVEEWKIDAEPLTNLVHEEERKGKKRVVIQKKLVELTSPIYRRFCQERERWKWDDDYRSLGPIQYSGPPEVTWPLPELLLE